MGFESLQEVLMCRGKVFHNLGAAATNARSPQSFNLDLGTTSSIWSADLKDLAGVYQVRRSERYAGASPCSVLKTSVKILKSI